MMRCVGCGYSLEGLGAGACPECGRVFDPADPASYESTDSMNPAVRRQVRIAQLIWLVLSLWPLIMLGMVHVMLVIARLELGRWPRRGGADDPKGIPLVGSLHEATVAIADLGTPVVLLSALGVLAWMMRVQWKVVLLFGLQFVALWTVAAALLIWDPARALYWFMD